MPLYIKHYRIISLILLGLVVILAGGLYLTLRELYREPPGEVEEVAKPGPEPAVISGKIALIIDDFGYNFDVVTREFLTLDVPVTFAVIPGHHYSQPFARQAALKGYEVIVHMPMESRTHLPGEDEFLLKQSLTSTGIEQRLELAFRQLPDARGINNHQGSLATTDPRIMAVVGSVLKRYHKFFIDSRTTAESVALKQMQALGVPCSQRDVFLDNDLDPALIREQLDLLARRALKHGQAIGIGHGKASTLGVLQEEIPHLRSQGFEFVFVSEIVGSPRPEQVAGGVPPPPDSR